MCDFLVSNVILFSNDFYVLPVMCKDSRKKELKTRQSFKLSVQHICFIFSAGAVLKSIGLISST